MQTWNGRVIRKDAVRWNGNVLKEMFVVEGEGALWILVTYVALVTEEHPPLGPISDEQWQLLTQVLSCTATWVNDSQSNTSFQICRNIINIFVS